MNTSRFKPSGVRSEPLNPPTHSRPRIGFVRPGHVERVFVIMLYVALLALVVLSVIGTYYGMGHSSAPLLSPRQIIADIAANMDRLWVALVIQGGLTVAQYGARQMARHDPRWWILYLVALGVSVYYNFQAYWTPLNELMSGFVAAPLIVAGDVLPEFIAIRHE